VGIERQFAIACTPQQNGATKGMNKTLLKGTRVMLKTIGLAKLFLGRSTKDCLLHNKLIVIYCNWFKDTN